MKAQSILSQAAAHLAKRAEQYDKPEGERSVPAVVDAFNAITGHQLTHAQGWQFLLLLKLVRAQTARGQALADSVEDATAYAALMGEEMLAADEPFKVGEMPKPGPIVRMPNAVDPQAKGDLRVITDAMVQAHEAFARSEAERLRKQFEGRVKDVVLPPDAAACGVVNHGVTLKGREPGSVHRDDTGERIVTNTGQELGRVKDLKCATAFRPCLSGQPCQCDPEGLI